MMPMAFVAEEDALLGISRVCQKSKLRNKRRIICKGSRGGSKNIKQRITYRNVKFRDFRKARERDGWEFENRVEESVNTINDGKETGAVTTTNDDWEEDKMTVAISAATPSVLGNVVVA
ncbi:hypothetical protein WAI453_007856 [Rhynchosporium graminicola]